MKTRLLPASVLVLALAVVSPAALTVGPKATKWQSTLTTPTTVTGAGIKITKTSKVSAKATTGSVTFGLKLRGVTDTLDLPVTSGGHTLEVDVLIDGVFHALTFTFAIDNGKISQKFPVANASLGGVGVVATQPIEIRSVKVIEFATGQSFGVDGLTAK